MRVETAFHQFDVMAPAAAPPGLPAHAPLVGDISTEQAAVLFGIVNGVFTSVSQLLAGSRLATVQSDTIPFADLAPALAIGAAGLILATRFIPSG